MNDKLNILCLNTGNSRTGAPILFIKLLQFLKSRYAVNFIIITTTNGALLEEFKSIATTYQWDGWFDKINFFDKYYLLRLCRRVVYRIFGAKEKTYQDYIIQILSREKFDLVYANSAASVTLLEEINRRISLNCKTVLHVHELEIAISQFSNFNSFIESGKHFNHYIVVSNAVKRLLIERYNINENSISLIYGCVKPRQKIINKDSSVFTVCGSGTLDWRKGIDIFIQLAAIFKEDNTIRFIWIGGHFDSLDYKKTIYDIDRLQLKNITITGEVNNPLEYMAMANVFVLTSREDPFPLVCLEAASLGKPIICFEKSGGMPEFVSTDCGYIVPYLSLASVKNKICYLKNNRNIAEEFGNNAFEKVVHFHNIEIIVPKIMKLFERILS